MPIVAVLPVKSFRLGKQRMASRLSVETRSSLGKAMTEHTAGAAAECGLLPLVVAGDEEVAEWAVRRGLPAVPDPGAGLDGAASAGAEWAAISGSSWLILHTDLPLLTVDELAAVATPLSEGHSVIAPSADGGTSALGDWTGFDFSYGPGSFSRHLARLRDPVVVTGLGLLHDVDSPEDLESARNHRRGLWLQPLLG